MYRNKVGSIEGIGAFIMVFVAVIVALSLLTGGITDGVGKVTSTVELKNYSFTAPAAGSSTTLPYQAIYGTVSVINGTGAVFVVPATNYTLTNYYNSNGQLVTLFESKAGAGGWQSKTVNISATTAEPFGYDTNSGGRTMAGLIIIFSVLAVAIFVIGVVLKNGEDIFG